MFMKMILKLTRDHVKGRKKQENPIQKTREKLAALEKPGTSGEEQVDRRSRHEQIVVTTTKEAVIVDCGHVVIDSANKTTYW